MNVSPIVVPASRKLPGIRIHRLRRFDLVLGLVALAMGAAGCGASRPIKYYQLTYPSAQPTTPDAIEATLMVRAFEATHLYLDDKIVYGFDSPQMGTYEDHRWAEPPVEILQNALIRGLRASGRFRAVYTMRSDTNGRFILTGRLYDFKEVDSKTVVARLNYDVRLRDRKTGTIVWSHNYSYDEAASEKSITAFVLAMDKNVHRSVEEMQAGLEEYFRAHPVK